MVLAHFMVLACVMVLAHVVVLACTYIICYMVLARVMLLAHATYTLSINVGSSYLISIDMIHIRKVLSTPLAPPPSLPYITGSI